MKCCLCGKAITDVEGHDPYPVRPESWYGEQENRCCSACNGYIVLPARIRYGRNNVAPENVAKLQSMHYLELVNHFSK